MGKDKLTCKHDGFTLSFVEVTTLPRPKVVMHFIMKVGNRFAGTLVVDTDSFPALAPPDYLKDVSQAAKIFQEALETAFLRHHGLFSGADPEEEEAAKPVEL